MNSLRTYDIALLRFASLTVTSGGSGDRELSKLGRGGSAPPGRGLLSYKLRANHHRRFADTESAEFFLILSLTGSSIVNACIREGVQRRPTPAWLAIIKRDLPHQRPMINCIRDKTNKLSVIEINITFSCAGEQTNDHLVHCVQRQ